MPRLTATPAFLSEHAAPAEWQERVQRLDPDLWVAWNPFHRAGPSWVVVKYHGRIDNAVHIVGLESRSDWQTLWGAMKTGWGIVEYVLTPDERPCDLNDRHLHNIAVWLGNTRPRDDAEMAEKEIAQDVKDATAFRKDLSDGMFHEAFEKSCEDEKTGRIANRPYAPGVIIPTAGDVAAFG